MEISLTYSTIYHIGKVLAFLWLLASIPLSSMAQRPALIDSLRSELLAAEVDSSKIYWLHRLTWNLISNDSHQAQQYNAQARKLANERGDSMAIARSDHYEGLIQRFLGNYPASIAALERALDRYEAWGLTSASTGAIFNLGVVHGLMGNYEEATTYLYRELALNESLGKCEAVGNTLNSLGSISRKMGHPEEALQHYARAEEILQSSNDPIELANVLSNTGGVYFDLGKLEVAATYFQRALAIDLQHQDRWGAAYNLHRLGVLHEEMGQLDSAAMYLVQALEIRRKLGQKMEMAETMIATGSVWHANGHPARGIALIEEALVIAEDLRAFGTQTTGHWKLATLLHREGKMAAAYQHLASYTRLRDSVLTQEKLRITSELSAKYETEVKDRQLAEVQVEITQANAKVQRQRILLQLGMAGFLALGAFVAMLVWAFVERKKRHDQRLFQLQQAQELSALKNVMTGEEKERNRIARELHDGLSSLLAAIKLQFNAVQQSSPGLLDHPRFNDALGALDDASREIRRIAHNMMPEILIKYGLAESLQEFVNGINHISDLHVEFTHFGGQERLPDQMELIIYRAAQELLNNMIRHSQASEILLQLNQHENSVILTAEDNGVGFDPHAAFDADGMGLKNLRSRVQYLQGHLSIESTPGRGSSFFIEIPLSAPSIGS